VFKQSAPRKVDIQLYGTSSFITVTTELKAHPRTGQEAPEGERRYSATLSLISALDWGRWSTQRSGPLIPGKDRYPLYKRLGGPHGRSGRCLKSRPPPGFDPSFPILKTQNAYAELQATTWLVLCSCGVNVPYSNSLTTRCCILLLAFHSYVLLCKWFKTNYNVTKKSLHVSRYLLQFPVGKLDWDLQYLVQDGFS